MPKQADEWLIDALPAIAARCGKGNAESRMPRHLRAFIKRGIQQGDDPKHIASLALELAEWWQLQWASELQRRVNADARLAKLTRKRPRGRPRKELIFSASMEPGAPGRPREWTDDLLQRLYKLVERERATMMRNGRARVTDKEAITALAKQLRAEAGESTSAHAVQSDVKLWQPQFSKAKRLFGNPRKKSRI